MTQENSNETEVVDGAVVPKGGIHHQQKGGSAETGVEPQHVGSGVMTTCKNGLCGQEFMVGVLSCPFCSTKQ